ncbi:hypothetical protein J0910_04435 [Nocardiopsis sp. CNT-189]|uniref:hypothetical protein n=1 Tax=Nocardiopsis oceanisediminis TaxID=2816862 RepID=UPI003B2B7C12
MERWLHTPVGMSAQRWVTRPGCRTVLVVVHSVACAQRLMDAVALIQADTRVQAVFTAAPSVFTRGVREWLADLDCVEIPWEQAEQTRFDLALAASYWGIERVHAPLVLLPHGAGFGKFMTPALTGAAAAPRQTFGLDRQRLVHDGRVVPSALVLAHESERDRLAASCPEALPCAEVVGDPVADRLAEALRAPARFRAALGLAGGERLALVLSTWGRHSLIGARPDLVARLAQEAREHDGWRAALLMHPNVWAGHGAWQLRAWTADWRASGLIVPGQRTDCAGLLAAADAVLGDHGSTTLYAALTGRPVAVAAAGGADVDPGSPMAGLLARAPRIPERGPVLPCLESLPPGGPGGHLDGAAARITSQPGRFAERMRRLLYDRLELPEPPWAPRLPATGTAPLRAAAAEAARGGADA